MYHVICSFIPANLVSAVTKGFNTCNTEFFRILGWGCLSLNIDVNCRLSLEGVARLGRGCAHGSSSRDPSDKLWDDSERRGTPVRWTSQALTNVATVAQLKHLRGGMNRFGELKATPVTHFKHSRAEQWRQVRSWSPRVPRGRSRPRRDGGLR